MPTQNTSEPCWRTELWRELEKDEVIKAGDWAEFETGHIHHGKTEWRLVENPEGRRASDPTCLAHVRYRRLIPSRNHNGEAHIARTRTVAGVGSLITLMVTGEFNGWVLGGKVKMIMVRFTEPNTLKFTYKAPLNWQQEDYEFTDAKIAGAAAFWDMQNVP